MAKNLCFVCQLTPNSFQICNKKKSFVVEGDWDDYLFLDECPKYIFFQLPKLNKYCLGVELDPVHQVIKKLKMDHLWVYTLYPTSCRNGYRM